MAKTQKYDDDLLVEAVIKYSESFKGKIKATELAAWAAKNIPGLEGVRDYMFLRTAKVCDPRTKKVKEFPRPCTIRMREINESRSVAAEMHSNVLLKSSDVNDFFYLKQQEQREVILKTREQMDTLCTRNLYLERENKAIQMENKRLHELTTRLNEQLKKLEKDKDKIESYASKIMKITDEEQRKRALKEIGVMENGFSLTKNLESLTLKMEEAFSISRAISGENSEKKDTGNTNFVNGIIAGINIDE